jgi:hypothetical protein
VEDLKATLEKLLTDAEDCAVIGKLATDEKKRELFNKLATDLRSMARDVEAAIPFQALALPDSLPKAERAGVWDARSALADSGSPERK